jgi:hypothetical protein
MEHHLIVPFLDIYQTKLSELEKKMKVSDAKVCLPQILVVLLFRIFFYCKCLC